MAHNYYRIPLRVRRNALKELAKAEPKVIKRSRCRRHRRKLLYLMNLYELRQKKVKWIETHIWHSKRCKMVERWGYKIPYQCSDKGLRTAYKLSQKESACIIDQSYYEHFLIKF